MKRPRVETAPSKELPMPSMVGVIVFVFMAVFFLSTCEVYYE